MVWVVGTSDDDALDAILQHGATAFALVFCAGASYVATRLATERWAEHRLVVEGDDGDDE